MRKASPSRRCAGVLAAGIAAALGLAAPAAHAVTLFLEDFDGYTSFPAFDPVGDPVNPGLPTISEGADERWYGIRFANPTTGGSIAADIAVQSQGSSSNPTPVGRVEDEAGIAFNINTIGLSNTTLDFDWRTFSASGTDRLRAGYFVGSIPAFATSDLFDARSTPWAWSNWTQLFQGQGNTFQHVTRALPDNAASVWVVFWLDNGEGDYGKVDNVSVTAVPEPSAAALIALGGTLVAARRRRLRSR